MTFAPLTNVDENLHRRQIAATANAALRGETVNVGSFSVPAGTTTYTLKDARLGVGKVLLLCPASEEAAKTRWYIPVVMNNSAQILFHEPPSGDAAFSYAVVGAGNTKGL